MLEIKGTVWVVTFGGPEDMTIGGIYQERRDAALAGYAHVMQLDAEDRELWETRSRRLEPVKVIDSSAIYWQIGSLKWVMVQQWGVL